VSNPTFLVSATAPAYNVSAATGTWKPISFNTNGSQRWQIGSDNSAESGTNAGSNFGVFCYTDNGASLFQPIAITRSTGIVNFSKTPVISAAIPAVTDNSGNVATTSWAQAVITNRIGSGGPFLPASCVGMPYDITIPYQADADAPPVIPAGYRVLQYVFVRKVVMPVGFAGSVAYCVVPPTKITTLGIVSTGSAGGIGNLVFDPSSTTGIFATVGGPFTFFPGDILTITTSSLSTDITTLAGISGTILGALSA
jgi:hypothetical protein